MLAFGVSQFPQFFKCRAMGAKNGFVPGPSKEFVRIHKTLCIPWGWNPRGMRRYEGSLGRPSFFCALKVPSEPVLTEVVRGVIIALDDDKRIRRALQVAQGIDFYRYEVKFNLIPSS